MWDAQVSQGLGTTQEGLCETFSTELQLCCSLGPAVDGVPGGF